ncbi:uncharacterized protein [Triticum aestivum]|uniref:uncharacterized protein n=1 Tax=Triticum aestivum TaxID=4565 RepID=UPI001D032D01|nr:uncharacterized protein LOC123188541 [Triticum aestivum]
MALEWVVRYAAGADAIMPLQPTPLRMDVLRHRSSSTSNSLYPLTLLVPKSKIWAKVYEANCISRQLARRWVAAALATGLPLQVSDRLFYSDIAVQFLIRKLLCFSTRNQSPSY